MTAGLFNLLLKVIAERSVVDVFLNVKRFPAVLEASGVLTVDETGAEVLAVLLVLGGKVTGRNTDVDVDDEKETVGLEVTSGSVPLLSSLSLSMINVSSSSSNRSLNPILHFNTLN